MGRSGEISKIKTLSTFLRANGVKRTAKKPTEKVVAKVQREANETLNRNIDKAIKLAAGNTEGIVKKQPTSTSNFGGGLQVARGHVLTRARATGVTMSWEGPYTNYIEFGAGYIGKKDLDRPHNAVNKEAIASGNPLAMYNNYDPISDKMHVSGAKQWYVKPDSWSKAEAAREGIVTKGWSGFAPYWSTYYELDKSSRWGRISKYAEGYFNEALQVHIGELNLKAGRTAPSRWRWRL